MFSTSQLCRRRVFPAIRSRVIQRKGTAENWNREMQNWLFGITINWFISWPRTIRIVLCEDFTHVIRIKKKNDTLSILLIKMLGSQQWGNVFTENRNRFASNSCLSICDSCNMPLIEYFPQNNISFSLDNFNWFYSPSLLLLLFYFLAEIKPLKCCWSSKEIFLLWSTVARTIEYYVVFSLSVRAIACLSVCVCVCERARKMLFPCLLTMRHYRINTIQQRTTTYEIPFDAVLCVWLHNSGSW